MRVGMVAHTQVPESREMVASRVFQVSKKSAEDES